ncbi:restriction endonuclease subunit S domain-containing protein [Latilactobacillus fragifolii]|uniref:restriction endonuclease subunit M n=1 Tax=Latilactobacillus fragifolii TaxID=2814244 RepID=UPI001ABB6877|nr:restriction endonuclease subunit M [Latilactobacillus fragifolii]
MEKLSKFVEFVSGSPQSRLFVSMNESDPSYCIYGQSELKADLVQSETASNEGRQIRTPDKVMILSEGDIIFYLVSGEASVVGKKHVGYLQTQNFIKLIPNQDLDAHYLVFLLNQDHNIKRQLVSSLQGTMVIKYTLAQLKALRINKLPPIDEQRLIGRMYFNQIRLNWFRKQSADLKLKIAMNQLRKD